MTFPPVRLNQNLTIRRFHDQAPEATEPCDAYRIVVWELDGGVKSIMDILEYPDLKWVCQSFNRHRADWSRLGYEVCLEAVHY